MSQSDLLTEQQNLAIDLLLQGRTRVEVAASCEISTRQLSRWMLEPEFKTSLRHRREAANQAVASQMSAAREKALLVLQAIAIDRRAKRKDRVAAAKAILSEGRQDTEAETEFVVE